MANYFAIAILPAQVDVSDEFAVESAVAELMAPLNAVALPNGTKRWDSYACCRRNSYPEWAVNYGGLLEDNRLFLFAAEGLTQAGVPYAVVTPAPAWFQSGATRQQPEDPGWNARAIELCLRHAGHAAVLLECTRG